MKTKCSASFSLVSLFVLLLNASSIHAATIKISGTNSFFEVGADSLGTVRISEWGMQGPEIAYPYLELREFWDADGPETGVFEQRIFLRIKLPALPTNSVITDAKLWLFWFDNNGSSFHSDYIDAWSVADEFTGNLNYNTYDGSTSNNWSDGFAAGVNGYQRTGPPGRFLGSLFHSAGGITNAASSQLIDGTQEYKIFSQVDDLSANGYIFSRDYLIAYLNSRIAAGRDALVTLSSGNGDSGWQRFISTSDNATYWFGQTGNGAFTNYPFLEITYGVPTPVSASITISSPDNVTLSWSAASNGIYQVQYKSDLAAATWTAIEPKIVATGSSASHTENIANSERRFYRVVAYQ